MCKIYDTTHEIEDILSVVDFGNLIKKQVGVDCFARLIKKESMLKQ